MITLPKTIQEAGASAGEYRAGGTDLQERRHHAISTGDVVDLRDVPGLNQIEAPSPTGSATPYSLRVGALVKIAALAADVRIQKGYPGLAQTAGGLATPEIRAIGTVGGNLIQQVRCWYYRNPAFQCLKKGGSTCFAREGDNLYHSCFDLGPCVAPHPSSLGVAFLAYDAMVEVQGTAPRSMAALFGDGSDPRRTHRLEPHALLTSVLLPPPWDGERSVYLRSISRARAEWPLVEVVVRLKGSPSITDARVVVGGVANIPLRLVAVEKALIGKSASAETLQAASRQATLDARPLSMTGYKVPLLADTVLEALERATGVGA